jgi:hypothetical protein
MRPQNRILPGPWTSPYESSRSSSLKLARATRAARILVVATDARGCAVGGNRRVMAIATSRHKSYSDELTRTRVMQRDSSATQIENWRGDQGGQ